MSELDKIIRKNRKKAKKIQQQKKKNAIKAKHRFKICFCGTHTTGKTSILQSFINNTFPKKYEPTTFNTFQASVTYNYEEIMLDVVDTAGRESCKDTRPLTYPETQLVVIVFSVADQKSFTDVKSIWEPEILTHLPNIPVLLVGNKSDLRNDRVTLKRLKVKDRKLVEKEDGEKLTELCKFEKYFECSAKEKKGLEEIFLKACEILYEGRGKTKLETMKERVGVLTNSLKSNVKAILNFRKKRKEIKKKKLDNKK